MKAKKLWAGALALLLVSILVGCSAKSADTEVNRGAAEATYGAYEDGLVKTEESGQSDLPVNQKLIRRIYIDAETEAMDSLLTDVEQRISALGGYVESRDVYNGRANSGSTRTASLAIRIPAEQLDQFVDQVSEVSNIISHTENTEDVTLSYVATESRVKALETEEARLLELLAKAESMNDLLTIESRLTDVRTELEEVASQLRLYDNQVNYGTIYLSIREVKEYTVVEEEPEGFLARVSTGFVKSLKNLGAFLVELLIFLIVALPYLLPVAAVVASILLIRAAKKRRKQRTGEQQEKPKPE